MRERNGSGCDAVASSWFGQFLMGFSLTLNHEEVLLTYLFCRHFRPKLHVKNSVSYIGGTILIN